MSNQNALATIFQFSLFKLAERLHKQIDCWLVQKVLTQDEASAYHVGVESLVDQAIEAHIGCVTSELIDDVNRRITATNHMLGMFE